MKQTNLFQRGDFTLASGLKSKFKIECDALQSEDWMQLTELIVTHLPLFGYVLGIPRGGERWAEYFSCYKTKNCDTILYVDDVWTTGQSMMRFVNKEQPWHGVVLFARGQHPINVTALFELKVPL